MQNPHDVFSELNPWHSDKTQNTTDTYWRQKSFHFVVCLLSWSKTTDIVITVSSQNVGADVKCFLSPTLGLQSANLHDTTNSITKSPKSECSCKSSRWHCICMYDSMCKCGEMAAHSIFSPNSGWTKRSFSWGMLTHNNMRFNVLCHVFDTTSIVFILRLYKTVWE